MKQERNELCNCGSGKKYKKCCLEKNAIVKFNCTLAVPHLCKAICCHSIALDKKLIEKFKDKIVNNDYEAIERSDKIFPKTKDGKCIFLNENSQCNIYENRPEVCENFGTIDSNQCAFISTEGHLRENEDQHLFLVSRIKFLEEIIQKSFPNNVVILELKAQKEKYEEALKHDSFQKELSKESKEALNLFEGYKNEN